MVPPQRSHTLRDRVAIILASPAAHLWPPTMWKSVDTPYGDLQAGYRLEQAGCRRIANARLRHQLLPSRLWAYRDSQKICPPTATWQMRSKILKAGFRTTTFVSIQFDRVPEYNITVPPPIPISPRGTLPITIMLLV